MHWKCEFKNDIEQLVKSVCDKIKVLEEDDFEYEIGDENISIAFPGDDNVEVLKVEDFIEFCKEIQGFEITKSGRILTTNKCLQLIRAESEDLEYYLTHTTNFYQVFGDENEIEISIEQGSIYLAVACVELGAYHEDFGSNYQNYTAVEIHYDTPNRLSKEAENQLILSYLFEIADTTGYIFYLSKIHVTDPELEEKIDQIINPDAENDEEENEEVEEEIELKPLIPYNEGMRLYVSAIQTTDEELKLLSFYKILEYFAPIVVNIESYDSLAKKLDSPKVFSLNRDYLKSIFDLSKTSANRLRDNEIIKSVFGVCFDIIELYELLPASVKKKTPGKEQTLNYEMAKDKIDQISSAVASIIYSTRNKVVHAKSNFEPTGNECPDEDLPALNAFLKQATARAIRWYNRLPNHQK